MPRQVLFALLIESSLIALTALLLTRPKMIFPNSSERGRLATWVGGLICLCITFCWSVVLGCILALNEVAVHI